MYLKMCRGICTFSSADSKLSHFSLQNISFFCKNLPKYFVKIHEIFAVVEKKRELFTNKYPFAFAKLIAYLGLHSFRE